MAEQDTVEVDVEDTVTIDLSENGQRAEGKGDTTEKKPLPRVRLEAPEPEEEVEVDLGKPDAKAAPAPAAPDALAEATKLLEEAKAKAERDAAAASATAASERQRREAAERLAQQRLKEAESARAEADTAHLTLIDRGIEAATGEVEACKAQLEAAYEAGDFKQVANLQARMSKVSAALDRLEAAKDAAAVSPRPDYTEGRVEAPLASPVDQYLSQFAPEAQTWLRQHPECLPAQVGGNSQANAKMMAGHYAAVAQNITPNTPDYFRVIEEHAGYRQPVSAAATVKAAEEAAPASKPRAQPSAPPSREPPAASGRQPRSNPRSVTLSREQQEMAKVSFPHLTDKEAFAQYARNLIDLESEGKLGRLTH